MNNNNKTSWWSIRNRILLFTIIATTLPAMALGWLYYLQSRDTLLTSAEKELLGTAKQAERGLDLWFQEKYYELRVLATYSYRVTENLSSVAVQEGKKNRRAARPPWKSKSISNSLSAALVITNDCLSMMPRATSSHKTRYPSRRLTYLTTGRSNSRRTKPSSEIFNTTRPQAFQPF